MKKLYYLILTIFLISACNSNPQKKADVQLITQHESAAISFRSDQKLEVLYYVFLLAEYPLISQYQSQYKSEVIEHYTKFKSHKAVTIAKELFGKEFVADSPVSWVFQYSDFPEFEKKHEADFPFEELPITNDSYELFRKELINFFNDTKSDSFLISQQAFLDSMILSVSSSYSQKNIIQIIEDYFGEEKDAKCDIILSPLLHSGGFSIEYTSKKEMLALIGPNDSKNSRLHFDQDYLEKDIAIHEFSHNYTNPIVDEFSQQTQEFEGALYPPIKEQIKEEGYASWQACMYELIVRATSIRIAKKVYGNKTANEIMEYDKKVGFIYIEALTNKLAEYEDKRDQYPTFRRFYPELIKEFERLRKETIANKIYHK